MVISPEVVVCHSNKPDMTMMIGTDLDTVTTSTSTIKITDMGTDTATSCVESQPHYRSAFLDYLAINRRRDARNA